MKGEKLNEMRKSGIVFSKAVNSECRGTGGGW